MKWTAARLKALKGSARFACVTAYDCAFARLADEAGIHLILVGDSLAMTVLGYDNTLPVTVEEMLHHTRAVSRGVKSALVVADMPFMSYHVSEAQAVENAGRFVKEAGADAVKIEGGAFRAATIERLVRNGIPVLAHVGLTPQSIKAIGGYKVQGRDDEDARRLVDDARSLQDAGAFAIVLECVPAALGAEITAAVRVPTVGIGAGPGCDAQVLVCHDLLGFAGAVSPKFVKRYAELGAEVAAAFKAYRGDVEHGRFPSEEHCY